jgi:excisionase family DNA binding protein
MPTTPLCLDTKFSSKFSQEALLDRWLSLPDKERIKQFLDTKHAAKNMAVSQRTIRLWIENGNIQAIRIGKKYHVYTNSLIKYISMRTLIS